MGRKQLEHSEMYRKTWAEINLDAIRDNVGSFRKHVSAKKELMAVVKANGYGHGAVDVAKEALSSGASWLGVALLEEAIALRNAGIRAPILVFGFISEEHIPIAQQHEVSVTIPDSTSFRDMLEHLNDRVPPLRFHLKLDTGMSRLGISTEEELRTWLHMYKSLDDKQKDRLEWQGIYTHLATADEEDDTYLNKQTETFKDFVQLIYSEGFDVPYIHMENSAGLTRLPTFPLTNLVRLGISMYGLYPSPQVKEELPFQLKEAFSLHTYVSQVKRLRAHTGISYGVTYRTQSEEWIGTIPIGYADGWARNLSNQVDVLVDGKRMNMVGRICMDQSMMRLDKEYSRGELATLIGRQGDKEIPVDEIARKLGTINYEIPCMISNRVPRIHVRNRKRIDIEKE